MKSILNADPIVATDVLILIKIFIVLFSAKMAVSVRKDFSETRTALVFLREIVLLIRLNAKLMKSILNVVIIAEKRVKTY
jgi:hypothetical protein